MFTDEDYREYIEAIIALEDKMIFYTNDLKHKVDDEEVSGKLEEVFQDETKHYAMGRGLYSSFFPKESTESNLTKSAFAKGAVTLTEEKSGEVINALLLLSTPESIGIESQKELKKGISYQLEINLKEAKTPENKKGEVVWFKSLKPTLGIGIIRLK